MTFVKSRDLELLVSVATRVAHIARDKGFHVVSPEAIRCVEVIRMMRSMPLTPHLITKTNALRSLQFFATNGNPKIAERTLVKASLCVRAETEGVSESETRSVSGVDASLVDLFQEGLPSMHVLSLENNDMLHGKKMTLSDDLPPQLTKDVKRRNRKRRSVKSKDVEVLLSVATRVARIAKDKGYYTVSPEAIRCVENDEKLASHSSTHHQN
ncbi:LOW QUALITY PROTEIN: hypothetical protein HID58_042473 [Brassica napus]|uniref:Uncharacterized protein n=1 Tax=Brassica napus TaxID=3708 RepID=A0ABQ8BDV3_BRANA|nr:LOW QUALITY PROTEIN: hypothetical protein HID58_042473 [Brassica napus]